MTDKRCWRYKAGESPRLFNSPDDVPKGEGWVDSPAKVGQTSEKDSISDSAPKRLGRPPKAS